MLSHRGTVLVPLVLREERDIDPTYGTAFPRPLAIPAVEVRWLPGLDAPGFELLDEAHRVDATLVRW
jgi:hypothetical protein